MTGEGSWGVKSMECSRGVHFSVSGTVKVSIEKKIAKRY